MLNDFEVIFCLDNLLLHVVLLDHLLYHQDRTMTAVLVDLVGTFNSHPPRWRAPSVEEDLLPASHCPRLRSQFPQLAPDPHK